MEFSYTSLFVAALLFTVLMYLLPFLFYNHKSKFRGANRPPPGTIGWPVLGESFEFFSNGWNGHPEKFIYDRITNNSSLVFKTSLIGQPMVFFCGAAGNKFLFTNENKLVTIWWPESMNKIFPSSKESSPEEEGNKTRKILMQVLGPESLRGYIGIMDTVAQKHFSSSWEGRNQVMVHQLAKQYTFSTAVEIFISLSDPNQVAKFFEPFTLLANGIVALPLDLPGTSFHGAVKAANFIRKQLLDIVKQRKIDLAEKKVSPTQDILSRMLLTSDENGEFMSEIGIADKILGLLVAGHDTASSVCSSIVMYLAEHPHVYQLVHIEQMKIANSKSPGELLNWEDMQEMKYSWNVACEAMRLAPPIQGGFRQAMTDFVYSGFSIPRGWKLYWSTSSTHLNPECFPEPEKFNPTRFDGTGPAPYTFIPFGGGPKKCPGQVYARFEILVFLHHIVKRFKWDKVIPEEKIIVSPLSVPSHGLPVRLHPHESSSISTC